MTCDHGKPVRNKFSWPLVAATIGLALGGCKHADNPSAEAPPANTTVVATGDKTSVQVQRPERFALTQSVMRSVPSTNETWLLAGTGRTRRTAWVKLVEEQG